MEPGFGKPPKPTGQRTVFPRASASQGQARRVTRLPRPMWRLASTSMSWPKTKPPQSVGWATAVASDGVAVLNFGLFGLLNLFRFSDLVLRIWAACPVAVANPKRRQSRRPPNATAQGLALAQTRSAWSGSACWRFERAAPTAQPSPSFPWFPSVNVQELQPADCSRSLRLQFFTLKNRGGAKGAEAGLLETSLRPSESAKQSLVVLVNGDVFTVINNRESCSRPLRACRTFFEGRWV